MKLRNVVFCVAALFVATAAFAGSGTDSSIKAGTPEAARTISRLQQARHLDQMNSQSYTGGENSEVGMFYARKAHEIDALLTRMRAGKTVSGDDVTHALDNSGAVRLGASM